MIPKWLRHSRFSLVEILGFIIMPTGAWLAIAASAHRSGTLVLAGFVVILLGFVILMVGRHHNPRPYRSVGNFDDKL